MKTLILQGSARAKGHTQQVAEELAKYATGKLVILGELNIHGYTYEHLHQEDDFIPLIQDLVTYDQVLLVTPVYWYAMSGVMKTFLDRITDCLTVAKPLGRQLRGKAMGAVACGSDDYRVNGFFEPFKLSANYLGMNYLGDEHTWIENGVLSDEIKERIERFATTCLNAKA